MDNNPSIRLNKVLRELNISLDRVIEFLSKKGISVEARPTTKISEEVYKILLEEFETDKSKRDASKEISEEKKKEKESTQMLQDEKENINHASSEAKDEIMANVDLKKPIKLDKTDPLDKESIKKTAPDFSSDSSGKNVITEKPSDSINDGDKEILEEIPTSKSKDFPKKTDNDKNHPEEIKTEYKVLSKPKGMGEKINLDDVKEKEKKFEEARKKRRKRISKDINNKGLQNNLKTNKLKTRGSQQKSNKDEVSDEDVQKQVRETLEKLQGKSAKSKGAKYRKDKRDQHRQKSEEELAEQEALGKTIKVTEFITVDEVATLMEVNINEIISACMSLGIMVTMNQRLDAETLSIVADEFGYKVDFVKTDLEEEISEHIDKDEELLPRSPIVTVMGHVDHGKTSLLDYIREENVIAGESGGITQHIGAYSVTLKSGEKITFLDTPGHEAFTAMRARGAQITDIAIIVIAADDDIMPQTKEAISHAQAASVPIIFAINKIDKSSSNPDKIKEALAGMNLMVEDWGGKIQSQDISALKGNGIDELLEKVLLEAEMLELKANPNRKSTGAVVEAYLDKGRGYVSTILVQTGTLKVGDYFLAGKHSGKVKAIFDERGKALQKAFPSTPVSILGLDGAPQAGDNFHVLEDEKEAKQIAAKRTQLVREQNVRTQKHITLDEIGRRIALGEFKELNLILKGDVDGSVEALTDSFQKLSTEEIQINIVHKGVGAITESDILLASASDAIVIGFNVRPVGNARVLSEKEQIDVRSYSIIYDAINDLKDAMEGMLSPEIKEEITGTAEVRETYKISKIGTVAGCMVISGKIYRESGIRVIREGVVQHTGNLISLKRFKDDAKEVSKGYDCGLQIKDYNKIIVGDILEFFKEVAIKKKL